LQEYHHAKKERDLMAFPSLYNKYMPLSEDKPHLNGHFVNKMAIQEYVKDSIKAINNAETHMYDTNCAFIECVVKNATSVEAAKEILESYDTSIRSMLNHQYLGTSIQLKLQGMREVAKEIIQNVQLIQLIAGKEITFDEAYGILKQYGSLENYLRTCNK
jgi:hypothetical protein